MVERLSSFIALSAALCVFGATLVSAQDDSGNVVQAATDAGLFPTLIAAVSKFPDIVEALSDPTAGLTVFAPNEDAFMKLIDTLTPPNADTLLAVAALPDILQYHVLPVKVMSTDLVEGEQEVETLLGPALKVKVDGGIVTINGDNTTVVQADIAAGANAVIHVIDAVLMPPEAAADEDGEDVMEAVVEAVEDAVEATVEAVEDAVETAMDAVEEAVGNAPDPEPEPEPEPEDGPDSETEGASSGP